jgi:hypothetical protein
MSWSESGRACLERAARILAEGEALEAEAAAATCHLIRRSMRHLAPDAFTGQQFKKVCSDGTIALRGVVTFGPCRARLLAIILHDDQNQLRRLPLPS